MPCHGPTRSRGNPRHSGKGPGRRASIPARRDDRRSPDRPQEERTVKKLILVIAIAGLAIHLLT